MFSKFDNFFRQIKALGPFWNMCDEIRFEPCKQQLSFFLNSYKIDNCDNICAFFGINSELFSVKLCNTDGMLGTIHIGDKQYLIHVKESYLVLNSSTDKVYRIKQVDSINVTNVFELKKHNIADDAGVITDKSRNHCIRQFFFYKDKEIESFLKFLNESPFYYARTKIEDDKFLWNRFLRNNMQNIKNQTGILYLYNGYFNSRSCSNFQYMIYSYMSSNRVGPRYFSRGVDSDGNVSNFVKTKYVVLKDEIPIVNITIYRGSVPVYWEQKGSMRELQCNEKDSFMACFKHFYNNFREYDRNHDIHEDIHSKNLHDFSNTSAQGEAFVMPISHFNNILVVNLLSSKKDEQKLSRLYKRILDGLQIMYFDFDLNKYHMNFKKLRRLFFETLHRKISTILETGAGNSTLATTKIIFRINCLDCLDRTNLASYLICDYFHTQIEIPKGHLKSLFIENGNAISLFNAGSNTLKNELAVKEKRSIKGLFDDFYIYTKRVISDKFNDKQKMEMIDMLLGRVCKTGQSSSYERENITMGMSVTKPHDDTTSVCRKLSKIHISSSAKSSMVKNAPSNLLLLISMKIASKNDIADINYHVGKHTDLIIICLNKVVSSLKSVFVDESIHFRICNFVLISKKTYFNNHIYLYAKIENIEDIKNVMFEEKKRNLQFTKKSCALALKFMFKNTKIVIINVIIDKIRSFKFFQEQNRTNSDIFIVSGIFLSNKFLELFEALGLNSINTTNNLKIGLKSHSTIRNFTEHTDVNFLELEI